MMSVKSGKDVRILSALYDDLTSRIPVVAMRTPIGRQRLQDAQEQAGLSNERIARLIPISEKTWRRWKLAGEVPTYALPRVAAALGLELVNTHRDPLEADLGSLRGEASGALADLLDGQGEALVVQKDMVARLVAIEAKLDELAGRLPVASKRRRPA